MYLFALNKLETLHTEVNSLKRLLCNLSLSEIKNHYRLIMLALMYKLCKQKNSFLLIQGIAG